MNTKNNSRRRESREKICKVFVQLLQTEELNQITVSDICKKADVNRSTFYANYLDVYDLADQLRAELESQFTELFSGYDTGEERTGTLRMFTHIKVPKEAAAVGISFAELCEKILLSAK